MFSVSIDILCRCFNNKGSWAISFLDNSTRLIMVCDNNFCAWLQCAEWGHSASSIEINLAAWVCCPVLFDAISTHLGPLDIIDCEMLGVWNGCFFPSTIVLVSNHRIGVLIYRLVMHLLDLSLSLKLILQSVQHTLLLHSIWEILGYLWWF